MKLVNWLSLLFVLVFAPSAFGQATRTSEEFDPALATKNAMAVLQRAEQIQARSEASYRQQVADYNRRADAQEQEQRRQYEDYQIRMQWLWLLLVVICLPLLIWAVRATRRSHRRHDAAVVAVEATRVQNMEIVAALHAIAVKLDEVKVLLGNSNRG